MRWVGLKIFSWPDRFYGPYHEWSICAQQSHEISALDLGLHSLWSVLCHIPWKVLSSDLTRSLANVPQNEPILQGDLVEVPLDWEWEFKCLSLITVFLCLYATKFGTFDRIWSIWFKTYFNFSIPPGRLPWIIPPVSNCRSLSLL